MKKGVRFIICYSVLSVCLFAISKLLFKELTAELFSYLLFYYLVTMALGIVLFSMISQLLQKLTISIWLKVFISFIFCLLMLNILPFIFNNRILSLDVLNGIFYNRSKLAFNTLGVHIIAIISFTICFLLFRKDKIWSNI